MEKKVGIMEIKENVYLSLIIAGKLTSEEDRKHFIEFNDTLPCCNRNWWYWKPFYRKTSIGWEIGWLCGMISYDNHNIYMRKYEEQKMAQEEIKDTL